jgi:hypothetical protein
MSAPYCLELIMNDGTVKPYGFHLGTEKELAREIAREKLQMEGVLATVLKRPGEHPESFTKSPAAPAKTHPQNVRECLETLPAEIRAAALSHATKAGTLAEAHTDTANALDTAFNWNESPEGFNFWESVYAALSDGKAFPAYPSGRPAAVAFIPA